MGWRLWVLSDGGVYNITSNLFTRTDSGFCSSFYGRVIALWDDGWWPGSLTHHEFYEVSWELDGACSVVGILGLTFGYHQVVKKSIWVDLFKSSSVTGEEWPAPSSVRFQEGLAGVCLGCWPSGVDFWGPPSCENVNTSEPRHAQFLLPGVVWPTSSSMRFHEG